MAKGAILAHMGHELLESLDGRIGEGWGGEGSAGIHINLVVARIGSPTAAAATAALANPSPGHVPFLVCAGAGSVIRPATVFINKTTLTHPTLEKATWGAAQLGVAEAVLDAVALQQFPIAIIDELVLLVAVWVDPALQTIDLTPAVETDIRVASHNAMTAAIFDARTPTDPATFGVLVAKRATITNGFYTGLLGN